MIYRDDQIGQIGTGFVLRPAMTGEDWQAERAKLLEQGIYPVCLQGHGTGDGRRFAAIFQRSETPVARVIRQRGSPEVAAIDDAVTNLMKASNIRGAALAIVNGTRLVYARSYAWAEPDYPEVEPTTVFRLASVSKLPIALAIHQAVAEKLLNLEDFLPQVIPLTNPDGSAPTNIRYLTGRVRHLLEYGGWFERYEGRYAEVRAAFNGNFPVTYDQIARYMLTVPLRATANDRLDDFGYFLAGQIIRRLRNKGTVEAALQDRLLTPLYQKLITLLPRLKERQATPAIPGATVRWVRLSFPTRRSLLRCCTCSRMPAGTAPMPKRPPIRSVLAGWASQCAMALVSMRLQSYSNGSPLVRVWLAD